MTASGGPAVSRPLATLVWCLAAGIPAAFAVLILLSPPPREDAWAFPLYGSVVAALVIAGALIFTRRPRNRVGWVLLGGGLMMGTALLGQMWSYYSLAVHGGTLPGTVAGALVGVLYFPALYLVMLIPFVFPDGRLMSWRWGLVAGAIVGAAAAVLVAMLVAPGPIEGMDALPNPFGIEGLGPASAAVVEAAGLVVFLAIPLGILATVLRYRRGTPVERKQLQWFASVLALAFSMFFLATILPDPLGVLAWIVASLSLALVPVAICIAILRYRLYDIDRIIGRTLAYAIVTAVLAIAFVGTNLVLQALIADTLRGGTLTVAGSTLVVAALFQPLRRRVQAPIDRRFDRAKADAEQVVRAFAARARDEVDLARLSGAVVGTVDEAVHPAAAALWLRPR